MIYIAIISLIISGSMLDSPNPWPMRVCALSLAYLLWFAARRKLL